LHAQCALQLQGAAMMQATKESPPGVAGGAGLVAVFESAERAEEAIGRLERAGFDLSRLSAIGKEEPSAAQAVGMAVAGAHARVWGPRGRLWASLAETPAAMALAWVPFIGYVVAVGPAASVLAGGQWQAKAAPPASALARMLTLAGMSPGQVLTYEAAVRGGEILLLMHGSAANAARARHVLETALSMNGR
jgi:hypothetical protein